MTDHEISLIRYLVAEHGFRPVVDAVATELEFHVENDLPLKDVSPEDLSTVAWNLRDGLY